jgi:hypothetical protein
MPYTVEAHESDAPAGESIDAGHLGAQHFKERDLFFEIAHVQSDMPDLQLAHPAPLN